MKKVICLVLAICLLLPLCFASAAQAPEYTLSLGDAHSALLTADGTLYTWGENRYGQLGDGTLISKLEPVKVLEDVVSVELGGNHSAAITSDGSLYVWGYNYYGQVGDGKRLNVKSPVKILDDVVGVSLGGNHSAAITSDGDLYVWGCNTNGQVGDGSQRVRTEPVKVLEDVESVSLGSAHSAAVKTDGSLWVWGCNTNYQLGDGTTYMRTRPVELMDGVKQVSLGSSHSACVTEDGELYVWGMNSNGEQGSGSNVPVKEPALRMEHVASVALGGFTKKVDGSDSTSYYGHSACITEEGVLYVWGGNESGEVGNGKQTDVLKPMEIAQNVLSVSLGGAHTAYVTEEGIFTCGRNTYGQLGDGQRKNVLEPTQVLADFLKQEASNPAEPEPEAPSVSEKPEVKPVSFTDVAEGDACYEAVSALAAKGIMNGTGDGRFEPAATLNRATALTVLWRVAGEPVVSSTYNPFSDVQEGEWYAKAVLWAYEKGIAQGVGEGKFDTFGKLTNQQLALLMYRFAKLQGEDVSVSQADMDSYGGLNIADWALTETVWALANGLLQLPEDMPAQSASRATVATVMYRFLED